MEPFHVPEVLTVQGQTLKASDKLFVSADGAARVVHRTRLLHDLIVLRFPKLPDSKELGDTGVTIALPDNRFFQSTMRDATVVAVGPGRWVEAKGNRAKRQHWHPTMLQVGDRVLIDAMHTQTGLLDEWDGERGDFRIVRESDIDAALDAGAHIEVA